MVQQKDLPTSNTDFFHYSLNLIIDKNSEVSNWKDLSTLIHSNLYNYFLGNNKSFELFKNDNYSISISDKNAFNVVFNEIFINSINKYYVKYTNNGKNINNNTLITNSLKSISNSILNNFEKSKIDAYFNEIKNIDYKLFNYSGTFSSFIKYNDYLNRNQDKNELTKKLFNIVKKHNINLDVEIYGIKSTLNFKKLLENKFIGNFVEKELNKEAKFNEELYFNQNGLLTVLSMSDFSYFDSNINIGSLKLPTDFLFKENLYEMVFINNALRNLHKLSKDKQNDFLNKLDIKNFKNFIDLIIKTFYNDKKLKDVLKEFNIPCEDDFLKLYKIKYGYLINIHDFLKNYWSIVSKLNVDGPTFQKMKSNNSFIRKEYKMLYEKDKNLFHRLFDKLSIIRFIDSYNKLFLSNLYVNSVGRNNIVAISNSIKQDKKNLIENNKLKRSLMNLRSSNIQSNVPTNIHKVRIVRKKNNEKLRWFSNHIIIHELQVWSEGKNVAFSGTPKYSVTYNNEEYPPEYLNDGNFGLNNRAIAGGVKDEIRDLINEYIEIKLDKGYDINKIQSVILYNLVKENRLKGLSIQLLNNKDEILAETPVINQNFKYYRFDGIYNSRVNFTTVNSNDSLITSRDMKVWNIVNHATNLLKPSILPPNVSDNKNIFPNIKLIGNSVVTIKKGSTYIDQGATASDNSLAPITIIRKKNINPNLATTQEFIWEAINKFNNKREVKRNVIVDSRGPVITLRGESEITVNKNSIYLDQGILKVEDPAKLVSRQNIDVEVTNNVNTSRSGVQEVTYKATDIYGNSSTVTRRVIVNKGVEYQSFNNLSIDLNEVVEGKINSNIYLQELVGGFGTKEEGIEILNNYGYEFNSEGSVISQNGVYLDKATKDVINSGLDEESNTTLKLIEIPTVNKTIGDKLIRVPRDIAEISVLANDFQRNLVELQNEYVKSINSIEERINSFDGESDINGKPLKEIMIRAKELASKNLAEFDTFFNNIEWTGKQILEDDPEIEGIQQRLTRGLRSLDKGLFKTTRNTDGSKLKKRYFSSNIEDVLKGINSSSDILDYLFKLDDNNTDELKYKTSFEAIEAGMDEKLKDDFDQLKGLFDLVGIDIGKTIQYLFQTIKEKFLIVNNSFKNMKNAVKNKKYKDKIVLIGNTVGGGDSSTYTVTGVSLLGYTVDKDTTVNTFYQLVSSKDYKDIEPVTNFNNKPPVIALIGNNPEYLLINTPYTDFGYFVTDDSNTEPTVTITVNKIKENGILEEKKMIIQTFNALIKFKSYKTGDEFQVTYTATDNLDKSSIITRRVIIVGIPKIELNGPNRVYYPLNEYKGWKPFKDSDPVTAKSEWMTNPFKLNQESKAKVFSLSSNYDEIVSNNKSEEIYIIKYTAKDNLYGTENTKTRELIYVKNYNTITVDNEDYFDLSQVSLEGVELKNKNLSGVKTYYIQGTPTNYPSGYILRKNKYQKKIIVGPGVYLRFADLTNVDFTGLDLTNVNMNNAIIENTNFSNIVWNDNNKPRIRGPYKNVKINNKKYIIGPKVTMENCDLSGFNFTSYNIEGMKFRNVNLTGCVFSTLKSVKLNNVDLSDVNLGKLNGSRGDLNLLQTSNLTINRNTKIPDGYEFKGSQKSRFIIGPNVDLSNMNLNNIDFSNSNLTGVRAINVHNISKRGVYKLYPDSLPGIPVITQTSTRYGGSYTVVGGSAASGAGSKKGVDGMILNRLQSIFINLRGKKQGYMYFSAYAKLFGIIVGSFTFKQYHLPNIDLSLSQFNGTQFDDCILTNANFFASRFQNVSFKFCDLSGADFTSAIFASTYCYFTETNTNFATKFPPNHHIIPLYQNSKESIINKFPNGITWKYRDGLKGTDSTNGIYDPVLYELDKKKIVNVLNNFIIGFGSKLIIKENEELIINSGKSIINNGEITNYGKITNNGKIINYRTLQNEGIINNNLEIFNSSMIINRKTGTINNNENGIIIDQFDVEEKRNRFGTGPRLDNYGKLFNYGVIILTFKIHIIGDYNKNHYAVLDNYGTIYIINLYLEKRSKGRINESQAKIIISIGTLNNHEKGVINNFNFMELYSYGTLNNNGIINNGINSPGNWIDKDNNKILTKYAGTTNNIPLYYMWDLMGNPINYYVDYEKAGEILLESKLVVINNYKTINNIKVKKFEL